MKNIFIDGGAHLGESIDLFKKWKGSDFDKFEIHSFEVDEGKISSLNEWKNKYGNITIHHRAIYDKDGTETFVSSGEGSSLESENKMGIKGDIEIETIDFSKWIIDNFNKKDYIILKLDIEGSEYRVIDKMFKDGSLDYIDELYMELHSNKCWRKMEDGGMGIADDIKLITQCHNKNLTIWEWDAVNQEVTDMHKNELTIPIRKELLDKTQHDFQKKPFRWTNEDIQTGWKFPKTIDTWVSSWENRFKQYEIDLDVISDNLHISNEIEQKGYCVLKDIFNKDDITSLYEKTKHYFKDGDRHSIVKQPLINSPEILPFVFNDYMIQIAMSYLKCYPALGTLNFRKSYVTDLPEEGVQLFHLDPNSPRFLKFFIYLNDVDENGGPFQIVEGSHKELYSNRYDKHRWSLTDIEATYGKGKVKSLTASVGDMIVATTNCFHRGVPPINSERTMLTLNYVIHPEEFRKPTFQIKQSDVDSLEDYKKPLTDFLIKV